MTSASDSPNSTSPFSAERTEKNISGSSYPEPPLLSIVHVPDLAIDTVDIMFRKEVEASEVSRAHNEGFHPEISSEFAISLTKESETPEPHDHAELPHL